ncbi:MAG TPA: TolC family protein [Terriglobales bacterium]|jgi:outer membrane protein TolC|nr:TolC family protein [Terriglobales bacterium]
MDEARPGGGSAELSAPFKFVLAAIASLLLAAAAAGQRAVEPSSLTLQQAVNIALEKNPLRKAAMAETRAASADVREARSFLMPRLTFSETATRGNDPVYVFGSKLRQQRFILGDFALNKLNTPLPFGNFTTRFGGSWNLFDSFASWHGVNRAKQMNEAAGHQLERTDQEIVFRVVDAYDGVLLAMKQLEVAEQAVKTAQAILDRSQARFDSGLVVESDLLSAKVRMAVRQQELIRARNNLDLARAQLNLAMGVAMDSSFQPSEALAERTLPLVSLPDIEKQALASRPDLKRITAEEAAQRQSVSIAKSSFGPRVNAFAGWEMDNPTFVAGGGGNNWLGGIEVQFDIFQGGAKRAELSRQRALEDKIAAMKQAASDGVRLEVRRAYYDVDASRQQVEVARASIAQANESLRINQDRYDSGLNTITGLLGAEEASRRSQSDYWEAVYRFHTSYANLELASGTLNPQSPVVTP